MIGQVQKFSNILHIEVRQFLTYRDCKMCYPEVSGNESHVSCHHFRQGHGRSQPEGGSSTGVAFCS